MAGAWEKILSQHADSIDVVVVWKSDPALDAITARWFDRVERRGDVQIFRRGASKPEVIQIPSQIRNRSFRSRSGSAGSIAQSFFFSFLSSNR